MGTIFTPYGDDKKNEGKGEENGSIAASGMGARTMAAYPDRKMKIRTGTRVTTQLFLRLDSKAAGPVNRHID